MHSAVAVLSALHVVSGLELQLHRHEAPATHRRLANGSFEAVPLTLGIGTHYTWAYVGNPPQRTSLIVDTGSHVMAFPCTGCQGCGNHTDNPFDASLSSTVEYPTCSISKTAFRCSMCLKDDDLCHITQAYSEGSSWKAVVAEDQVSLGESALDAELHTSFGTRFQFGCQKQETGLFITQAANGIMGLSNHGTNIVRKLYNDKKIDDNIFSLCFTKNGGTMALGAPLPSSERRRLGALQFARVSTEHNGWYAVTMREIRIGGNVIDIPSMRLLNGANNVIIDSGTTTSYLPRALRDEFDRAFKVAGVKKYMTEGNGNGYSKSQLTRMPTIEYVMEGMDGEDVVLTIPPALYLKKGDNGRYAATIALDEQAGGVIGADLMTNHDFIFDPDMNRVGFVPANCNYKLAKEDEEGIIVVDEKDTSSSWEAAVIAEVGAEVLTKPENDDDDYPIVNTIVGVFVAVLFLGAFVYAVVRKPTKTKSDWAQLSVDDDDDEANELMVPNSPRAKAETYDTDDAFFDTQLDEVVDHEKADLEQL